jgi:hypothetical protein
VVTGASSRLFSRSAAVWTHHWSCTTLGTPAVTWEVWLAIFSWDQGQSVPRHFALVSNVKCCEVPPPTAQSTRTTRIVPRKMIPAWNLDAPREMTLMM